MHRFILFFIAPIIASTCIACAASTPSQKADKTYSEFIRACSKNDPESAKDFMIDSDLRIDPCPSDVSDKVQKTDIIAAHSMAQATLSNGSWQINPGQFLTPNTPQFVLKQLKYAILNQDLPRLMQLISTQISEEQIQSWLKSSEANEIYSAIAITPNPWFVLEGKSAICKVAGRQLRFELVDNVWRWQMD